MVLPAPLPLEQHRDHRDIQCAEGVRKMVQLRKFEQEFIAYGTVEWHQGKEPVYRATMQVDKLIDYQKEVQITGSYFTPLVTYSQRRLVPAGCEEAFNQATKLALLAQMKHDYQTVQLFERLTPLFLQEANNNAYDLLLEEQASIEGYFDFDQLQCFEGLLISAYQAKVLTQTSFNKLFSWLEWTRKQMEGNPVIGDQNKRTFYGFVALDNKGLKKTTVDAKRSIVYQKWEDSLINGSIVSPILVKTYYFHRFNAIKDLRKDFSRWLDEIMDFYFPKVLALKNVSGVVAEEEWQFIEDAISSSPASLRTVHFFKSLWNTK